MKTIAALLVALLALAPIVVFAAPGNGKGPPAGKGPAASPAGNGPGAPAAPSLPTPPAKGNPHGTPPGHADPDSSKPSSPVPDDQNTALDAVESGSALPLDQIIPRARQRWGGRVIDAALVRVQGALLYRLTMISDQGVSRRIYYDARSGNPVEVH